MHKIYTNISQIAGDVITVSAPGVGYSEIAQVETRLGTSLAQVIRLDGDKVYLQVFAGSKGISTGDKVRFLGHPMQISTGDSLLGRIFSGAGEPLDKGPALSENIVDIAGPPVNPVKRIIPNKMIRTGLPMIDVFNSLVESQKLPLFSIAGAPYNELLARIATQAEIDIIILGGMGLKYDDYLFFKDTLREHGA
ncbi:MAG: V-type ATP synthase subunit B, partial [Candidatus Omnitrophica bacterium]|nr:V-type ATP synthase subunit B [Candidatus Omnitrophota bacterium]